jgi:uncharacterized membrane protein YhhN
MIFTHPVDCTQLDVSVYVFFGIFCALTIVECVFAFLEKEGPRKVIKPFCVLMLAIIAILYKPDQWLIYTGALLGVLGDIFLIWKHNHLCFGLGMGAFLLGHIAYIAEIISIIYPSINWAYYVAGGFLVLVFNLGCYHITKKVVKSGKLAFVSNIYLSALGLVPIAALVGSCVGYFSYLFLTFLGGLAFVASDSILAYTIFTRDIKRRDFFIMAFYLLGQAGIVFGLLLSIAAL